MSEGKTHLGVVIVGTVDAGKSTTTGHLLFELGGISDRELAKLKEEAETIGKGSFAFAFYMDKNKEERARGVTIQCATKEFFTDNYHYTIIDAPGHKDFIKNMISGASQADVALIMVPADAGGFEASIQKENRKKGVLEGQSKAHARLCKLLGIEQVIVGVNKMDAPSVNWSQERYEEIKSEMSRVLDGIGYKSSRIPFVPFSGWTGANLIKPTEEMPWWKGFDIKLKKSQVSGVTLLDALNNYVQSPKRKVDQPMRCSVTGQFQIKGVGTIVTGNVLSGTLKVGDQVRFSPSGAIGKVFTIEMHHKNVEQAIHGDNIGMSIKGLTKQNMCKVGDIMFRENEPMGITQTFRAGVYVQNHPGKLHAAGENGKGGFTPSCHVRTGRTASQMIKIHWKRGKKSTGGTKVEDPQFIEAGDEAEVTFRCVQPFCCGPYSQVRSLGRVAFMDSNSLVMLGKIISVEEKPLE